ncbi:MAG: HRDC domain-containing protein [Clostridia bacterium]|nr:HRDC domain-containing protein [Clostridia bacterium]
MILEILRGTDDKTKKTARQILFDRKYEKIKTFGTLKLTRDNLKELINYLIGEEYLVRKYDDDLMKKTLKITQKGNKVLSSKKRVFMRTSKDYNLLKKTGDEVLDLELFNLLKMARSEIAKITKQSERYICYDYTLKEIAMLKPKTLSKLMDIKGLGEFKVKKFGDVFCEVVRTYEKGGLR